MHRAAGCLGGKLPYAGTASARREDGIGTAIYGDEFESMKKGFYIIMAAQFFSSLADNALLVAAISLLMDLAAPDWMTPMLKFFFQVSYVLFAAFVGYSATQMFLDKKPKPSRQMPGLAGQTGAGSVIGFLSGLVGAGGGFVTTGSGDRGGAVHGTFGNFFLNQQTGGTGLTLGGHQGAPPVFLTFALEWQLEILHRAQRQG